jgi:hypothetical protein
LRARQGAALVAVIAARSIGLARPAAHGLTHVPTNVATRVLATGLFGTRWATGLSAGFALLLRAPAFTASATLPAPGLLGARGQRR